MEEMGDGILYLPAVWAADRWNSEWRSLGRKTAADYSITFDKVPRNALLWLRDLSKGREERPFTYENNRQIWW